MTAVLPDAGRPQCYRCRTPPCPRMRRPFFATLTGAVFDGATGELLEYRYLIKHPKYIQPWKQMYYIGNETGHLFQGIQGRNNETGITYFISRDQVPEEKGKKIMNSRIVCNERPQKVKVNRARLIVDGRRLTIH